MAGDSNMVATGNNDGTMWWGADLPNFISLAVMDDAVAGRSARSFTREGRFKAMATSVKKGDYVNIEFGHNDGGSLTSTDNGRLDCSPVNGNYATTCQTTYNGTAETVLTYYTYLYNAAKLFQGKGANVIISSATPEFVGYAEDAASASGSIFVDHGLYTADLFKNAGANTTDSYYPHDHTHTSPAGAEVVARAFILALEASNSTLKNYVTSTKEYST